MNLRNKLRVPSGAKAQCVAGLRGTAGQAAEKVESVTSAAEAAEESKAVIAALKRCATPNQTFPAACEAVPYPKPIYEMARWLPRTEN